MAGYLFRLPFFLPCMTLRHLYVRASNKTFIISVNLKKSILDRESLSSYRSISNLPFISKLIERLNKTDSHNSQNTWILTPFSIRTSLLRPTMCMKQHSTETVLVSIHDHLVQAVSHQSITGLCLLDRSAAFDAIDYYILLERLSHRF